MIPHSLGDTSAGMNILCTGLVISGRVLFLPYHMTLHLPNLENVKSTGRLVHVLVHVPCGNARGSRGMDAVLAEILFSSATSKIVGPTKYYAHFFRRVTIPGE